MKHTYSSININSNKSKDFRIFNMGMNDFILNKGFDSPKASQTLNRKTLSVNKNNYDNIFSPYDRDKNSINIRLNIKSQIINNNFDTKKYDKVDYCKLLDEKDKMILELKEEINEAQRQIDLMSQQSPKYSMERSDCSSNSGSCTKMKKIQKKNRIKPTSVISKNVRQFFKNLILKKSKNLSKTTSPTSYSSAGSMRISINTSGSALMSPKYFLPSPYLNIDTMLSRSPRFNPIYNLNFKTMTKSNSLVLTRENKRIMGVKSTKIKKIISQRTRSISKSKSKNKNKCNNKKNKDKLPPEVIVQEMSKLKSRAFSVFTKYLNSIRK